VDPDGVDVGGAYVGEDPPVPAEAVVVPPAAGVAVAAPAAGA
jgi:hypothetical protein